MKPFVRFCIYLFTAVLLSAGPVAYAAEENPMSSPQAMAININTADAELIAEVLKGIGLKKAQAIVAWREQHGKFTSVEQLTEIKGVGEGTLAKNAGLIRLN